MPLNIPTRRQVASTLQSYVRADLPALDPTPSRRSKIGAWIKSVASSLHDWHVALKDYGDHEPFPQSARGQFLYKGWWRPLTKLDPLPASVARGDVVMTGTAGTLLPEDMTFSANGRTYTAKSSGAIVTQSINGVVRYAAVSAQAVVVTTIPHQMCSGMNVTISGATVPALNGTFAIQVSSETSFYYNAGAVTNINAGADAPVSISATWGVVVVQADTPGATSNISSGGTLTVTSSIAGAATTAIATAGGVSGGADAEQAEAYRARVLKALGTDFGAFTGDEIEIVARNVPGVTRVFVRKATRDGTNGVFEGQVHVAFLCDDFQNPIPTAQKVADVKAAIVSNCMTANTAIEDVVVISPTPRVVNFTFTSIVPDTIGVREAVRNQLRQLFDEAVTYGEPVTELDYECAIKGAVDLTRRTALRSFVLASPSGPINTGPTEMPMLGSVNFG